MYAVPVFPMSSRTILILVLAVLGSLSVLAYFWRPKDANQGRTPLIWVTDNNPARFGQIEAFNGEHPEILLKIDSSNIGVQKTILQSSTGIGPDLFDLGPDDLQNYVAAGIAWDVTEPARRMGFSTVEKGWPKAAAIPLCYNRQYAYFSNVGTYLLIYNKNIFDYFEVPYPEESMTWDQFLDTAAKVNSATASKRDTRQIHALSDTSWGVYFQSIGGEYFAENGLPDVPSDKLRQAFQWQKDMLFKHGLMPSSMEVRTMSGQGGWGAGSLNQFAAGRFAMMFYGDYGLIAFTQAYRYQLEHGTRSNDPNPLDRPLRLGASLVPCLPGSPPTCAVVTRMTAINARSPNREEALKVLQFFAGPTYSSLVNRDMDWLPGNPEFVDLGVEEPFPDLSRRQMHEMSKKMLANAYFPRRSPFILAKDVHAALMNQARRMESDRNLKIDDLLAAAAAELDILIQRNISRDPELTKLYHECTARAAMDRINSLQVTR